MVACGALGCAPGTALAWDAGVDGSTLRVTAAAGEANRVDIDVAPDGNLIVTDEAGAVATLGAGCTDPDGEGTATCSRTGVTRVVIDTGDLDDTVSVGDLGVPVEVHAGAGNDSIEGGDGNDQLTGSDGDDTLSGAAGQDRITGDEGSDQIDGGADADDLDGGGSTDQVLGGAGNDLLQSTSGGDLLDGGDGNDQLEGDEQSGTLRGGDGNDVLNGYGGNDQLDGGDGDDALAGGTGADQIDGGPGRDTVSYDDATQGVAVSLDGVANDGTPGEADDVAGDIEVVVGSPADDTLVAGPGPVELHGSSGNDRLIGSPAADLLDGGDGDDTLDGGSGPDVLSGAEGNDTVTYAGRIRPVDVSIGSGDANDGQAGEHDDVRADVETVTGSPKGDRLTAGLGLAVTLDGGAGPDTIVLPAISRSSDLGGSRALCGTGTDTVKASGDDAVAGDCDIVTTNGRLSRLSVQGEPSPRLRITIHKVRLGKDRVLRVPVYCGAETAVRCTATVRIDRNGKRLGTARAVIGRGRSATVRIKLRGSQVTRVLRAGGAVVIGLSVRDKAGTVASGKAPVSVKRVR